ncbi:Zinc finger MYM-type protein 1 [Zea mays]|uniref:Zinc finger MYM-type protein 1 n=1 Tax=Zea mays TaxID=4577 RepID=A0A3L6G1U8_MAIZE|nr:Zinc finger MYM-type protein 1 [Zea mays]
MQLVIFQEPSNGGTSTIPSEQVRVEVEPPTIEHGEDSSDSESAHLNQIDSSDEGDRDGIYGIEHDPSLRLPISSYDVNDQDTVRRAYVALGPCRPKMNKDVFPQHECGGMRRFQPKWFSEFNWLEYSVAKDAAYCFVCYLFKDNNKFPGGDSFVSGGFRNWNMKVRFLRHAGGLNSAHCEAEEKYNLFMKPKSSIRESIASNSVEYKAQYLARLTWSLQCIRYLLRQGLAFRGHAEGKDSNNKGNFRELLQWLAWNFEEVNKVVLGNAPNNCQLIDHKIQKQLICCCANETTKIIMDELGDECFAILADESSDAYQQEQLALCLRYVNKIGEPVERFLGLVKVANTTSLTLKEAIQSLLLEWQLPLSKIRGQGYDGASGFMLSITLIYKNAINYHRFHADMFLGVIDRQLVELNNRFDEVNTELLRCMASFSPAKNFSTFDVERLVKLAGHYPHDFEFEEKAQLPFQLNRYIEDVRNDENFKNLKGLAELSMMLVKTDKILRYDIVYKLLKLVLVLPVATAGVERIFSSMNYIKKQAKKQDGSKILEWMFGYFY